ncbi:histone deacetylase 11-like isoform X2 [Anneissia japonica]|uniref:histone deacetylase 11-like isoform X2 n=1 Tax=Anneissia japonica TaxID=1529436 RepID=UPI00142599AE|nr:histone deacetylase 11-like isoform X2 [Anneissia japonica]
MAGSKEENEDATSSKENKDLTQDTVNPKQHERDSEQEKEEVHETKLYFNVSDNKWPIIYSPEYNIGFLGLEKLHPFDSGKWGKVFGFLKDAGMLSDENTVRPVEPSEKDLRVAHTKRYLKSLRWSVNVASITEVPPVAMLPNFLVQRKVLRPCRLQTGGTILAGKLAMERGWAINVGGGFHHSSGDRGGGFCAYADITLTIKFLLQRMEGVSKAMIVDLDAHQGNGHERDFMGDDRVYIMDAYNRHIYPHDGFAKRAIHRKVELEMYLEDPFYLDQVSRNLEAALKEFTPDVIVYNAGTDVLRGDNLGALSITPRGIVERDEYVFQAAKSRKIPIVMVTSGGYQRNNAEIIAMSILNLRNKQLINCDAATQNQESLLRAVGTSKATDPVAEEPRPGLFSRFFRGSRAPQKPPSKASPTAECAAENIGTTAVTGDSQESPVEQKHDLIIPDPEQHNLKASGEYRTTQRTEL